MHPQSHPCDVTGRDPVAAEIEDFLRDEMAKGHGNLSMSDKEDGVAVSFADSIAIGANYDIAFIRLANLLLDDDRHADGLRAALRHLVERPR